MKTADCYYYFYNQRIMNDFKLKKEKLLPRNKNEVVY